MPQPLHAIVNLVSGSGRTRRNWPELARQIRAAGFDLREHFTAATGNATEITRRLLHHGAGQVLAVGGDGTINEVANGFFHDGAPIAPEAVLSVFPCGTGSDFARNLGIGSTKLALETLRSGCIRSIDVGRISHISHGAAEERYFVNSADVGFGARTAAWVNRSTKAMGGFLAYLVGATRTILLHKSSPAKVLVDGELMHDGPLAMVLMANGRYHAGGMLMAPNALMDDGLFDILLLADVPRRTLIGSLLPRVYRGRHMSHPAIGFSRGRHVEICAGQPLPFEVDGEQPGSTDLRADLLPGALRVRMPAGGSKKTAVG